MLTQVPRVSELATPASATATAAQQQAISVFQAELRGCIARLDEALRVLSVHGPAAVAAARGTNWVGGASAQFVLATELSEVVRAALVDEVRGALDAYARALHLAAVTP